MLLKDARFVLTPGKVLENESIVVEDRRIKSIGESEKKGKVIDASNYAVLPGLVNMHTHASMNLFRGVSDDKELQSWLEEEIWPLEEKLDGEKCYWGAMHAFVEMIKTGTTCFNDMYFFMDKVAEAADKIGIRGYLGHGMLDMGDEDKREEELEEASRVAEELSENFSDRINPTVTPHSCEICSEELLLRAKELANKHEAPLHMHLAETHGEVEKVLKEKGKRPVEHLKDLGLLDEQFVGAHGVHLTEKDIKILSGENATVVHNPCSNMKLASGVAPVSEMLQKNLNVSLGTDGVASNNNLNMFEEMKFAALLQKLSRSDSTSMPLNEVVKTSSENAGRALNEKTGRVEEGYLADLILVDIDSIGMTPLNSLKSNLVYSGAKVDTSIINGEVVMEDGKVKGADEQRIKKRVEEISSELVS